MEDNATTSANVGAGRSQSGGARTTTAGSGAGAARRARRRDWGTRRLTPYVRVLDLSFASPPARGTHSGEKVDLQVQKRGRVDAVGYRWRMDLGFGEAFPMERTRTTSRTTGGRWPSPWTRLLILDPACPFRCRRRTRTRTSNLTFFLMRAS